MTTADLVTERAMKWVTAGSVRTRGLRPEGWVAARAGLSGAAGDFITLLRTTGSSQLANCASPGACHLIFSDRGGRWVTPLHPKDKSHLVVVNEPFHVLLNSVCQCFIENFCIDIYLNYWLEVFFPNSVLPWLWYLGNDGLAKWVWECPSSLIFVKSLRWNSINSSSEAW